jgi:hypothetical protein
VGVDVDARCTTARLGGPFCKVKVGEHDVAGLMQQNVYVR